VIDEEFHTRKLDNENLDKWNELKQLFLKEKILHLNNETLYN